MPRPARTRGLALCLLPLLAGAAGAHEAGGHRVHGEIGFLLRDLTVHGSDAKHGEDSDGLGSGPRLGSLLLEWHGEGERAADRWKLEASGLGGDPAQHVRFDISRSGLYSVAVEHSSRRFLYDLFALSDDKDGHAFHTRSERTTIDLTWHPAPWAALLVGLERQSRGGDRLFMKNISRDIFLMDAPADDRVHGISVGTELKLGKIRIDVSQALRTMDRRFRTTAHDNPGLNVTNRTFLDDYVRTEDEDSSAHITTLRVRTPLGKRVFLSASYRGTPFEPERLDSRIRQDAAGTAFAGTPLLIDGGAGKADIRRDHGVLDAEIAYRPASKVVLRFGWRTLDISDEGVLEEDLAATGVSTRRDVNVDVESMSLSSTVEYRPVKRLGLSVGYRIADRVVRRQGQGGAREGHFESKDDATVLARASWKPSARVRINAEREQADLDAAFSALSPLERTRTRLRLTFTPSTSLDIGLTAEEYESANVAIPSRSEGRCLAVLIGHRPHARVAWSLAWTRSDVLRVADVIFDGAATGGPAATFPGQTIFDVDQDHVAGHVKLDLPRRFTVGLRLSLLHASGREVADGSDPNVPPAVPSAMRLSQDYRDWELEFERELASGFFIGSGLRWLDHDDADARLDYRARAIELRLGQRF